MKLILKNFRCFKNNEFEFDNLGLTLIKAPSGSGKSTILMAINFVLYGKGTKVITFGENSCSVELIFNENLTIKRSKKPNVLIVNKEYEDEVGQKIINNVFGETFDITGYIHQNALNSFIIMSSSEKLQFLENITFADVKLNEVKERVKNLIKKEHDELTKLSGEISMCQKVLLDISKPDECFFPFKTKNEELSIKNEEIRLKNVSSRIEKTRKQLSQNQNEFNAFLVSNSYIKNKKENLDKVKKKIKSLEEKIKEYDESINYSEMLSDYSRRLDSLKSRREINGLIGILRKDEINLKEMKKNENKNFEKEILSLTANLWKDYSKEECLNLINDMNEAQKDFLKIKHLEDQINKEKVEDIEEMKESLDSIIKEIENKSKELEMMKKYQTLKECPSCKEKLIINEDDNLVVFFGKISKSSKDDVNRCYKNLLDMKKKGKTIEIKFTEMKLLLESIDKIKLEISRIKERYVGELYLEDIEANIEDLQTYLKSQILVENKINDIKLKISQKRFSYSLEYLENDVMKQRMKIAELNSENKEIEDDNLTEDELQELIMKTKTIKEENERIILDHKLFLKEKVMIEKDIDKAEMDFISKFETMKTEEEMKTIITKMNYDLLDYEKQKSAHQHNLNEIKKYLQYKKEKNAYEDWINQLKKLQEKENLFTKRYSASLLLKQSLLEAESIALVNIVNNINLNASIFLEEFFPTTPIAVNIVCFKEVKNNSKPQLNVEVLYKDMMCDLSSLSGGEISRVILAFTLSLANISHSPLLLLDETTASLDEELTTIVFTSIKEHFRSIPILSISHQCTDGIFDCVVNL